MSVKIIPAIAGAILLGTWPPHRRRRPSAHIVTRRTRTIRRRIRARAFTTMRPGIAPGSATANRAAASCAFGPAFNDTNFDVWVGGDGC